MQRNDISQFRYSWDEAIDILRNDPEHQDLIFNSYLTGDLVDNCERFAASAEFSEVLKLARTFCTRSAFSTRHARWQRDRDLCLCTRWI